MDSERRVELEHRRERIHYARAQELAAEELAARGLVVGPEAGLAIEACRAALDAVAAQEPFHLVWHRIWGVRLRAEMIVTVGKLADVLGDDPVTLVWNSRRSAAAFAVSPREALKVLGPQLGPGPDDATSDLVLFDSDGEGGLVLNYEHHLSSDDYELRTWGRFDAVLTS